MKLKLTFISILAAALGGCAGMNTERLPDVASQIELVGVSSSKLIVRTPEIQAKASQLELDGVVERAFGADSTERTHLTVSFYDQTGRILQSDETDFAPRNLNSYRRSVFHRGSFKFPLAALPPGTNRIEVRAHE
jgi:hypothetical protein